jgi:uncharacterized protein YuzE
MKLRYDKETDSMVIIFKHSEVDDSEEIRAGVIADFDKDDSIVCINFDQHHRSFFEINND